LFSFCINLQLRKVGDAELMRDLGLRSGRRLVLAGLLAGILVGSGNLAGLAFGQAPAAPEPPRTILLIRHAEKPTSGMDLAPAGFARAKALPELFGGVEAPHTLPRPDFLFATHVSKNSNRPVETITPLSAALGLPISHEINDKDYAALAKELLSGRYAGKVVLVAWHHGSIPMLARALGATPPYDPWPDTQFDRVWKIDFHQGQVTLTDLPQGLMPGDSK
jgi:broad specificity phosphatase PhoE